MLLWHENFALASSDHFLSFTHFRHCKLALGYLYYFSFFMPLRQYILALAYLKCLSPSMLLRHWVFALVYFRRYGSEWVRIELSQCLSFLFSFGHLFWLSGLFLRLLSMSSYPAFKDEEGGSVRVFGRLVAPLPKHSHESLKAWSGRQWGLSLWGRPQG